MAALGLLWWAGWPPELAPAFWVMAGLAVAVDARPNTAGKRRAGAVVLPSVCFTFAIVLAWGFVPALAVQAVTAAIAGVRAVHPVRRTVHLLAQYAAALGAAAAVAGMGGLRLPLDAVRWTDALLVLGAAVAWTVGRAVTASLIARLVTETPRDLDGAGRPRVELPSTGAMLLLGAVLPAVAAASAVLVPLVLVPLFAVDRMARSTRDHARAARADVLTGLPNRRALLGAAHRLGRSRRGALLLLDLDRFKDVNDALGQPGGDRLLTAVADRLAAAVAPHDVVARLGGDEFAVLATRVDDSADARRLARHLTSVLEEPVTIDGLPVDVSAAVGVALHPEHGDDVAALLQHAEIAMYEAKQRGETCVVYAPGGDGAPHRLALLADLRAVLRGDESAGTIGLWYQPQVAIADGEVLGVEALLRWRHPLRGMVDPEEVVRVAEQTAVMRLLTARVVADAVAQAARWRAAGHRIRVAVNVSVRDLHTGDLGRHVEELLAAYDLPADLLQIELTESALLTDARQVLATIGRLHQLGVAISLDDFGTGWSSLQHLRRLPLSEVKIDRSFVLGMTANAEDAAIVRSVIELAAALRLRVVAEGVEDERTWRALHAAGCHSAQGWFYARPMPADEFGTWLSRYRPVGPAAASAPAQSSVAAAVAAVPSAPVPSSAAPSSSRVSSPGKVTVPLPAQGSPPMPATASAATQQQPQPEPQAEPESRLQPEAQVEPESRLQPEVQAEPASRSRPEPSSPSHAEPGPQSQPHLAGEPVPFVGPVPAARPVAVAGAPAEPTAVPRRVEPVAVTPMPPAPEPIAPLPVAPDPIAPAPVPPAPVIPAPTSPALMAAVPAASASATPESSAAAPVAPGSGVAAPVVSDSGVAACVAPQPGVAASPASRWAAPAVDQVGAQRAQATQPRRPDFVDVPLPGMPEVVGDRPARTADYGPNGEPGSARAGAVEPER